MNGRDEIKMWSWERDGHEENRNKEWNERYEGRKKVKILGLWKAEVRLSSELRIVLFSTSSLGMVHLIWRIQ